MTNQGVWLAAFGVLTSGCIALNDYSPFAVQQEDGGPIDGGPIDGGPIDGGPIDGGPIDGGPIDGGPIDGGPREDAGRGEDAATPDDAGPPDAATDGGAPGDACVPGLEVCDGFDNDCDPSTPDGMDDPALGQPCDGPDPDLCEDDAYDACTSGGLTCGDIGGDLVEICNGIDDDCDGVIDEGAGCPCLHTTFDGHAYLFCGDVAQHTDFTSANASCPPGYSLVKIDSAEEQAFVLGGMMSSFPTIDWWLGATSASTGGVSFLWVADGSEVALGYQNWQPLQPDGNGPCLELDVDATTGPLGGWTDELCSLTHPYVCETLP